MGLRMNLNAQERVEEHKAAVLLGLSTAELRRGLQKAVPLLVVERDGKAAEPVDADPAFFSNAKFECAGAPSGALLLQFGDARFEFLIRWLGHVASPARWNRNGIIHCVFDLGPRIFSGHRD